jgi:Family of unknown function (DUF5675)
MRRINQVFPLLAWARGGFSWTVFGWFGWLGGKPKMSDLILTRDPAPNPVCTMGEFTFNGQHLCWTLEPPRNNPKEPQCIAPVRAKLVMQWSTRFQEDTPHLLNVPNRSLIEIHPLNNEHLVTLPDGSQHWTTEGCIGVGETKDVNWVGTSVLCLTNIIIPLVEAQLKLGDFYIQVIDPIWTSGEAAA